MNQMKYFRQPVTVGQIYEFRFVDDMSTLDGLYVLRAIHTPEAIDQLLHDPFETLYALAGKQAEYISNKTMFNFKTDVVYEVVSVDSVSLLHVPESLLSVTPVGGYKEYDKLQFIVQVGVIPDQTEVESTMVAIQTITQQRLGISPRVLTTIYGTTFLTTESVEQLEQARSTLKHKNIPPEIQIEQLRKERDEYAQKAVAYEKFIEQHLGGIATTPLP